MDHLPHDPAILVSAVNMLLRDEEYDSLGQLCYAFGEDEAKLRRRMLEAGYVYSTTQRQFRPIGYDNK